MLSFGEIIEESSRAFADDEEEEISSSYLGPKFIPTELGKFLLESLHTSKFSALYFFNGKVARGFGEGYLGCGFKEIGSIYYEGSEGTVDSLLRRASDRALIKLFFEPESKILFAFIDSYASPRAMASNIVEKIEMLLNSAESVHIFHSDSVASFYGGEENNVEGSLFVLHTSKAKTNKGLSKIKTLPQPNIVSGISAAVLTHCEKMDKVGVLYITFTETELIDSISIAPFVNVVQELKTLLSTLPFKPTSSHDKSSVLISSNLYI